MSKPRPPLPLASALLALLLSPPLALAEQGDGAADGTAGQSPGQPAPAASDTPATPATAVSAAAPADGVISAAEPPPNFRYLVGANLRWQPEAAGARRHELRSAPLWALQWGRWRIATSGSGPLLGFGSEARGPGASTEFFKRDKLRLGLSLRIDNGRDSGDASSTAGLADVRRTVRARFYGSYALSRDWLLSAAVSPDLLGRQGGVAASMDLGWRLRQSARSEWTAGGGVSAGNAVYMRSYFGVSPQGAASSGLQPYAPGAGLRDLHAGVDWTVAITPRWIAYTAFGTSYLMGPAADSPLTQRRLGTQLAVGLAYRN